MFGKSKDGPSTPKSSRNATGSAAALSIIAADMHIVGNVSAEGEIHLDGQLDGDVACSTLLQGETSRIAGSVMADTVTLRGTVEGTVTAKSVTLTRTARVKGDLIHETLTIETGARVDGRMSNTLPLPDGEAAEAQPLQLAAPLDAEPQALPASNA